MAWMSPPPGELAIALDTGIDARQISFAGPGKSLSELDRGGCGRRAAQRRIGARGAPARGHLGGVRLARARGRARQPRISS
jgi:hypothetical protein